MKGNSKNSSGPDLVAEALSLLAQSSEDSAERRQVLADWAAQSPEHTEAMAMADAEWSLFAKLPSPAPRGFERLQIGAETVAAQVAERPVQLSAAALALVAVLAASFYFVEPMTAPTVARVESDLVPHAPANPFAVRHATDIGEQVSVVLDDGSTVWLNWESEIDVEFVDSERHVDLKRGAAVFQVTDDPDRPFIVHAGEAIAQVIGTEFAVHRHDADHVVFEVKKGVVAVNAVEGHKTIQLAKAEAVTFRHGVLGGVREASVDAIGAWRDGLLIFDEHPLIEVLDELGHYTSAQLHLAEIVDPERPVTATFFIDDADGALESLKEVFDLVTESAGGGALSVRSNPD